MAKKKVYKVEKLPTLPILDMKNAKLKVVAYARVSTHEEKQKTSLEAQKSYYEDFIKKNAKWKV